MRPGTPGSDSGHSSGTGRSRSRRRRSRSQSGSDSDSVSSGRRSLSDGTGIVVNDMPMEAKSVLYKTELCRKFESSGYCRYGDKCQFAHGVAELRPVPRHPKYKTERCRTYWTTGSCPYGSRCRFLHDEDLSECDVYALPLSYMGESDGACAYYGLGTDVFLASGVPAAIPPAPVLLPPSSSPVVSPSSGVPPHDLSSDTTPFGGVFRPGDLCPVYCMYGYCANEGRCPFRHGGSDAHAVPAAPDVFYAATQAQPFAAALPAPAALGRVVMPTDMLTHPVSAPGAFPGEVAYPGYSLGRKVFPTGMVPASLAPSSGGTASGDMPNVGAASDMSSALLPPDVSVSGPGGSSTGRVPIPSGGACRVPPVVSSGPGGGGGEAVGRARDKVESSGSSGGSSVGSSNMYALKVEPGVVEVARGGVRSLSVLPSSALATMGVAGWDINPTSAAPSTFGTSAPPEPAFSVPAPAVAPASARAGRATSTDEPHPGGRPRSWPRDVDLEDQARLEFFRSLYETSSKPCA